MPMLPEPRRIVTGHNDQGQAIVIKDSRIPCEPTGFNADFAVLWETDKFPTSNDGDEDPVAKKTLNLANKDGIVLRVVDFPPNAPTAMHRTISLDFGILFEGELDCHFDSGEVVHMKPGDVCVQRGTMHGWTNPTDKPARMYFILTAAEPVTINGKSLDDANHHDKGVATGGH